MLTKLMATPEVFNMTNLQIALYTLMELLCQMEFEHSKMPEKCGEVVGFVFGYFMFTTVLFFILMLTKKLPLTWEYYHVMAITLCIFTIGKLIKRLLK